MKHLEWISKCRFSLHALLKRTCIQTSYCLERLTWQCCPKASCVSNSLCTFLVDLDYWLHYRTLALWSWPSFLCITARRYSGIESSQYADVGQECSLLHAGPVASCRRQDFRWQVAVGQPRITLRTEAHQRLLAMLFRWKWTARTYGRSPPFNELIRTSLANKCKHNELARWTVNGER